MPSGTPRRPYDSGRRQEAAHRNRAAILAAGRELLFRDGYQATTVRAVAERAGVSPETVYKAFGGKPGLVKALWDITLAGDDEPLTMAERPQLQAVLATRDGHAKLRLYAGFVRGVHERLAALSALLAQAGPDVGQVLALSEQERMTGVTAFVAHLTGTGVLPADIDAARLADSWWALTGPHLYTQLTSVRGWAADTYEDWLTELLTSALPSPP
ncbi:helix-turn-helix domain-containing protein [Actinocorallia sp. A-T 12471]|uniref:TetR/AcrR family transcriptional regulator n=1 Tax=Actinocorallia sp. A-T 12471 TaxID=3089813 RepID=UPI0029CE7AB0|nr:helix-turn-helix domain-containing protein [Actinocorallia sp. A-T 12471]MDX6743945.1 helix-turn-helix domain-containing protein [Actinocorallia sp. A-T 12471]